MVYVQVRRWGNSFGVIIPKEVVEKIHIHEKQMLAIDIKHAISIKDLFGAHKFKKSTDEIMEEIDEGWE